MSDACPETVNPSIVSQSDKCALQNNFLSKESLKIVTKALIDFIQPSCGTTKLTFDEINKWIGSVQSEVKLQKDFTNMVKDKWQSASTEKIYLNGFLKDIAAITNLSDAQYYSTSMQALSTFTPTVRFSKKIKFLENVDETLALVCSDLLQHSDGGITFIYDDSNKLFFLIHLIKNIYFNTFKLTDGWMGDTDVKKKLIDAFKSAGNPHTYILLLKPETSFNYSQEFLKLVSSYIMQNYDYKFYI
ncbi:unnamed protein product [Hymenolepis diminuta]|uniref:Uncharacterized protein n=1 Tax=Hymenolepis diminuta TaxID=6216 RepID=A0A564ZD16_HYMDI|nr:unnamed protein product [Hymenolepis diminuta]